MKAKEYEKILQDLSGTAGEAIHIVDKSGKSIIYNEEMASLERTKREDVLGKPYRESFSYIPIEESTLYNALKKGRSTINKEQTYLNQYGKEITTVNSTVPVELDGHVIAAIEIANDITHFKDMTATILDLQSEVIPTKKVEKPQIKKYTLDQIIGSNPVFREIVERAGKAAKIDASVFIYGETGTGKELFAQGIHYEGPRKEKPFLAQNCAAIPESLLEGTLFGTSKGGFTGAEDRAGLFEQANGGTLLLDEISAMPYDLQSKLLRVLQEDYIRRVGGSKDIPVDVRIIATVNEAPEQLIQSGALRKDLYYRLNIVNLTIPPLRERLDDLPLLIEHFLEKYNKKYDKEVWMVEPGAMEKLRRHTFPGNIRELENIIMSAVSLADKEHVLNEKQIRLQEAYSETPAKDFLPAKSEPLDQYMTKIEIAVIKQAMATAGRNISKAAAQLGIKRQTLQHKLKKYNI